MTRGYETLPTFVYGGGADLSAAQQAKKLGITRYFPSAGDIEVIAETVAVFMPPPHHA